VFLVTLANVARPKDRLDEAAAGHHEAIARDPNYAEAYNYLGNVLRAQGRLVQALAASATLRRFSPISRKPCTTTCTT
jgi:tetratricopeptide (TPR) repeat protein